MASETHSHDEPMRFTLVALLIAGPALAQEDEETPAAEAPAEETPAEEAPAEAATESAQIVVEVALDSGLTLRGTVLQENLLAWGPGSDLIFTPDGGTSTTLPGSKIVAIGQPGQVDKAVENAAQKKAFVSDYTSPKGFSVPNPAASRYLYAPSSINMKAG